MLRVYPEALAAKTSHQTIWVSSTYQGQRISYCSVCGRQLRVLDLFCGAGGASAGCYRAGFDVTGVDLAPQRHYPFRFVQADAVTFPLDGFDLIHGSPPCQHWSGMSSCRPGLAAEYPMLIDITRDLMKAAGKP